MHIDDVYISLIVRFLKGEISVEEQQELFHWVYQNRENESLFYSLKDIWESARYESISSNANTDAEWERLAMAAIKSKSVSHNVKQNKIKVLYRVMQVAAIVIVALALGFWLQNLWPQEPQYSSINVPFGAKSELQLPDGSRVWVNSGSLVKYPARLDAHEITLFLEGEAFFDIEPNPRRVVNVKTSTINIQVHGTSFNVRSYNDEDVVEATLLEGSISISGKVGDKIIKQPVYLKPNEQITISKSAGNIDLECSEISAEETKPLHEAADKLAKVEPRLEIVKGIDPEEFVMWKYNVLVFRYERFEDLAVRLERWYDVEITIEDEELKNSRYTGTFEKENIEQALHALSISLPFKYTIDKNRITISKKLE